MGDKRFKKFLSFIKEADFDTDEKIIIFVDSLPEEVLQQFDEYIPTDLKHYCKEQSSWFNVCEYYLGEKLHRKPTNVELVDDYQKHYHNDIRFRTFYAIKFQELVKH